MANTTINGVTFTAALKDYTEGRGVIAKLANFASFPDHGVGENVTIPVVPFIGEAEEVVNGIANYTDITDDKQVVTFKQFDKGVKLSDEELLKSVIDVNQNTRVVQLGDALIQKRDKDLLSTLDSKAAKFTVDALTPANVLKAEAVLGQYLDDGRALYLIGNGTTVATLQDSLTRGDLTKSASSVYDANFIRFNGIEDGAFYLVQEGALTVLEARGITAETWRESDFHGDKINANSIYGTALTELGRAVKVTVSAPAASTTTHDAGTTEPTGEA